MRRRVELLAAAMQHAGREPSTNPRGVSGYSISRKNTPSLTSFGRRVCSGGARRLPAVCLTSSTERAAGRPLAAGSPDYRLDPRPGVSGTRPTRALSSNIGAHLSNDPPHDRHSSPGCAACHAGFREWRSRRRCGGPAGIGGFEGMPQSQYGRQVERNQLPAANLASAVQDLCMEFM